MYPCIALPSNVGSLLIFKGQGHDTMITYDVNKGHYNLFGKKSNFQLFYDFEAFILYYSCGYDILTDE